MTKVLLPPPPPPPQAKRKERELVQTQRLHPEMALYNLPTQMKAFVQIESVYFEAVFHYVGRKNGSFFSSH